MQIYIKLIELQINGRLFYLREDKELLKVTAHSYHLLL